MISIKSEKEIEYMREAGRIVALAHKAVKEAIKPGITTKELDDIATKVILENGAIPSFKGQPGLKGSIPFPASICASVNDEIIHGIPGGYKLKEGDIISIDIGACKNGYHGDSAKTHPVGKISENAQKLIDVTRQSFYEGMKYAKKGNRLSDISHAIQEYAESNGCSVVREFVGHGIGKNLHEDPEVPNYGRPGRGPRLEKGMTIAVEPMINEGIEDLEVLDNRWTIVTADGKLSAHYEHTVLITDGEVELLTICE